MKQLPKALMPQGLFSASEPELICTAACKSRSAMRSFTVLAGLLFTAAPMALHAQTAAPTREELQLLPSESRMVTAPAQLSIDDTVERGPCPLAEPDFAQIKVSFSSVTFSGLPGIAPEALAPAWQDMAGRELPVVALCEVRDRAATMLRKMGYIAAVQVPTQRIEKGGVVQFDVLAAKLSEVQVRGEVGHADKLVAAHLARLSANDWFNIHDAERQLLLLGDLPGYDARLTLRSAGKDRGQVLGDVVLTRTPFELVAGIQNLGSKATGREAAFVQLTLNDVTGLGDQTLLSVFNTLELGEQTVAQVAHDFAVGSNGLRVGGNLVYGRSRPDTANGAFRTTSWIGKVHLSYPLQRRQAASVYLTGGLELADQAVNFGTAKLSRDRLRIAYAGASIDAIHKGSMIGQGGYSASEPLWRFSGELELRTGLSAFGASRACSPLSRCLSPNIPISDLTAKPQATVIRFESQAEFRPTPAITIAFSPRGQFSSQRLLGYEQFSLGNFTIGRGLDPGIVMGDSGLGAGLELRIGKLRPKSPKHVSIQPYAMIDAALAWNNDQGLTAPDPRRVYTAGGGVRAMWGDHINANLMVAVPLRRAGFQTTRGDTRVLFTIAAKLFPWSPQ